MRPSQRFLVGLNNKWANQYAYNASMKFPEPARQCHHRWRVISVPNSCTGPGLPKNCFLAKLVAKSWRRFVAPANCELAYTAISGTMDALAHCVAGPTHGSPRVHDLAFSRARGRALLLANNKHEERDCACQHRNARLTSPSSQWGPHTSRHGRL
jgi:hypothetical protein